LLISTFSFAQELEVSIPEKHFAVDESKSLIVSRIADIEDYSNTSTNTEVNIKLGQKDYTFNVVPDSLVYSSSYQITDTISSNQYTLYFTPLPIISITATDSIVDEPKILASLDYSDDEQTITSNIGIELRGASSLSFPKKTYDLEFWEDNTGDETQSFEFGEMRSDDDWILDALYNEPLRIRSYLANKLWLKIHTPYYKDDESKAKAGADVMYVELFLDGKYTGVYNLSEQVDKKQLKLKSYNGDIRGELYKGIHWGASTFSALPSFDNTNRIWSGYEYKYPKESEVTDWGNVYNFTDFVMNSPESDFKSTIWDKFNKDNFSDYFLFVNLIRATDNLGKNIYLAKYKVDEPYFYAPWDLDGCFGTIWDGTQSNITNDILTNGFMSRVIDVNPDSAFTHIAERWFDYRDSTFSNESLIGMVTDQYNFLKNNKLYERETLVFNNYPFSTSHFEYTTDWLEDRLKYLDIYFGGVLSNNDISINPEINFYPNPVKDLIYLSSEKSLKNNTYKLLNVLGKEVQSGKISENTVVVKDLNPGYYFLKLDKKVFKFIKE
jgi:hypothetical protein